jgi:hypothetical protein
MDFKGVLMAAGRQQKLEEERAANPNVPFVAETGFENEEECLEKRVFYRVMSGMHASISTHLCWDFLNQTTGQWTPNLQCYVNRLHKFPDRISNLYFNYALVTRAIAKIGTYIQGPDYTFCTGDRDQDADTRAKVLAVTQAAASVPQIFDESLMFKNGEGPSLKEDFRNRFRNVSRLMDCVGCDKCRLWGKIQTNGYGTALKILFEFDNNSPDIPVLKRTELVALFNTYARISSSLRAVVKFRAMVDAQGATEVPASIPGEAKKAHNIVSTREHWRASTEELDDEEEPVIKPRRDDSLKEEFNAEFERVVKAFKIVVRGWLNSPSMLWHIFSTETRRLYQFFVGLPVTPRTWSIELPHLDEL